MTAIQWQKALQLFSVMSLETNLAVHEAVSRVVCSSGGGGRRSQKGRWEVLKIDAKKPRNEAWETLESPPRSPPNRPREAPNRRLGDPGVGPEKPRNRPRVAPEICPEKPREARSDQSQIKSHIKMLGFNAFWPSQIKLAPSPPPNYSMLSMQTECSLLT